MKGSTKGEKRLSERREIYDTPSDQDYAGQTAASAALSASRREDAPEGDAATSFRQEDGIVVIRFNSSEIKEIAYARRASKELKDLAIAVGGNMLLSLENVMFLSSVGVAALVSFHRAVCTVGGKLKICGVRSTLRGLFSAAGLENVLEIYDTKAAAMWAFKSARQ